VAQAAELKCRLQKGQDGTPNCSEHPKPGQVFIAPFKYHDWDKS